MLIFINALYLHLLQGIGQLLLAGLATVELRVLECFVPSAAIGFLQQLAHSSNPNDTLGAAAQSADSTLVLIV